MKKVGLITYHKSYNYGAMLQVYATQYIIKKMGYDCKIIDYVNKDEEILKIYLDDKDMSIKEILDCFKITDKKVKTKLIKEIIL